MWIFISCLVFLLNVLYCVHGICIPATNVTCPAPPCKCELCDVGEHVQSLRVTCGGQHAQLHDVPKGIPLETEHLDLSDNSIGKLGNRAFSSLVNLKILDLRGNRLDSNMIYADAFYGLEKLETLLLQGNYVHTIKTISNEWFRPLKNLFKVDLQGSRVETVCDDAFRYNMKLAYINLVENNIKYIGPTVFRNLPSLRKVLLQKNQIQSLPDGMINGSISVNEVNLGSNKILTIQPSVGFQYMKNLTKLDVHDNPLNCDCDLIWFREWIDTTHIIADVNNTKCASGQPILQFNPNDLQCEFPVIMVTAVSVAGVIVLCSIGVLLFTYRWRIRYGCFLVKFKVWTKGYETIPGDNVSEYKYDIFVSHSSKDEEWVQFVLKPKLENPPYNYRLCLDFRDFVIGEHITTNIVNAIEESRKTVFILTKNFIDSEWCYFELEMIRQKMFDEHRDAAILVLKDNIPTSKMPGLLKYFMRKGNYIRWSDNKDGEKLFWKKLEAAVRVTSINMV
ncbi:toll-like receptor 13 [Glandiceps talaboti]